MMMGRERSRRVVVFVVVSCCEAAAGCEKMCQLLLEFRSSLGN